MSSIDKLKRLTGENIKAPAEPSEKKVQLDELRRRIDDVMARRSRQAQAELKRKASTVKDNLHEYVSGEEIENELGKFFLASDIVHSSSRHGYRNIRETFGFDMTAAAMLANNPSISHFCCSDALFLDTETTGLAGGTGTMAFLIGLGWFEEDHFHVRQLLARDFGEEKAALAHLAELAAKKKFLITFNGKAFDVNLLTTRFIMNRLKSDLNGLPHLDLLHPSRRILGHRLANSRLCTLEAEVLGVEREGDIPGWEIPQRYFDWLKKRDGRLLAAIFEHNRLDVISMAALTAHLTEILDGYELNGQTDDTDYLAAARLLLNRHNQQGAARILNRFGEGECGNLSALSKKDISLLYKRCGRSQDAAKLWEEILALSPADYFAASELAKWLEHRVHDCPRARRIVEEALQSENNFSAEEKESLLHRLKRLNAKAEGSQ
ncbi:MAG TPA: ribonuclease H-like domain-containing protein [Smithellaceae bacterium]|nr:ribonuclease H-like domain-containing protein [Smithellaceae bacterium]